MGKWDTIVAAVEKSRTAVSLLSPATRSPPSCLAAAVERLPFSCKLAALGRLTVALNTAHLFYPGPFAGATEAAIFRDDSPNRATIVVTHRLVGMARFDTILVIDQGRIVARTTHNALMAQWGLYRRLYEQQNAVLAR